MQHTNLFQEEKVLFEPTYGQGSSDVLEVIYAFPNEYTIGITSLGYQVVWRLLASLPGVRVARLFTDIHEPLPAQVDAVGFSFSWELDFVHVITQLENLGISLRAEERGEEEPIVFGGGPVFSANPEPFSLFLDVFLLGDGEELVPTFMQALQQFKGLDRKQKLLRLAQIPGLYVPSLYEVDYESPTSPVVSISSSQAPSLVQKQTYRGNKLSSSSVVTAHSAWENIFMVEVVRSCPEMCRFCLASYLTLPFRTPSLEGSLIPLIQEGLKVTPRLGLLGASVTQHPEFESLIDYLDQDEFSEVHLSVSSVRANTLTPKIARTLAKRGSKSVTIAVESGSERLRQIINKKLSAEEIHQSLHTAMDSGLTGMKLYGMAGVPGETFEDLEATIAMLTALKKEAKRFRLSFGCSTFVPKAHTPFQVYGVDAKAEKKLQYLAKALHKQGVDFRPESYSWSVIQALIARGDRRVGEVLLKAREYGGSLGSFKRAFKELKGQIPPLDFYVHENWNDLSCLPWNHLMGSVVEPMLNKHLLDAQSKMILA